MSLKYVEFDKIRKKTEIIVDVWESYNYKFVWQAPCDEVLTSGAKSSVK